MSLYYILILLAIVLLLLLPFGLWIRLKLAGIKLSLIELAKMRLRLLPVNQVVICMLIGAKAGIFIQCTDIENHIKAGGNIENVITNMVSAKTAGFALSFKTACEADLQKLNIVDALKKEYS